jgi:signal transduction histidine kinase
LTRLRIRATLSGIIAPLRLTIRGRMLLGFATSGLLLFGIYGVTELRQEARDLRTAIEREVSLLGRSVEVSIENALRDRQLEDVHETLAELEAIDPTVDILVFGPGGSVTAASDGAVVDEPGRSSVLAYALSSEKEVLRFDPAADPTHLIAGFPLHGPTGTLLGAVVIARPLDDMRKDLATTRHRIILVVVLFVLITTAVGVALSSLYLRRPLGRIVSTMQAVRAGELRSTLTVEREDEVGAVAREFNAMVETLLEAREQLVTEAEARVRLERGLRQVDKMVTIGQLAAGLAHEIGSPLQVVNGRARALATRAHDPEATRRNAEILAEQSERISRIVEHLLHFGRRSSPTLTSFDLTAALRRVTDFVAHEGARRQVSLTLEADDGPITVEADRDQMQQVALNLLTNALAATPPGGTIRVRVSRDTLIGADTGVDQPAVRLEVSDTGPGIPEEVVPSLFEPFFTTRAAEGGTGLGLSVVKGIIAEHGGTISVDTGRGAGTTFVVYLPLERRGRGASA